jgi:hypothetical protein
MRSLIIGIVVICASLLPAQTVINGGRTLKGPWDASGAMSTKPAKTGATIPGTCSSGELFFKTNDPAGQNLYVCNPDNTWNHVSGTPQGNIGPVVFDGSRTTLADGSTVAWTCGTGSGAQCTTSWTVPAGVNWVRVQMWGGGAAGGGSIAGSRTGGGGSGGGYTEIVCATAPGSVSIAVGLGGVGASGDPSAAASGGNSSFGTCITVTGGIGGWGASGWPGRASGATNNGYYYGGPGAMADWGNNYCRATDQGGAEGTFIDEGGCGAGGISSAGGAGDVGGKANGGGGGGAGSGSYNNTTQAAGGVSVLGGGSGGHGGAWTSGGGYIACSAGSIPGGGGGSAGAETAGGSNHTGCNGARGEVRVYFAQ